MHHHWKRVGAGVLVAAILTGGPANAQTGAVDTSQPVAISQPFEAFAPRPYFWRTSPFPINPAFETPAATPIQLNPPHWSTERRACEGCPRRSVGRAFLDTTIINVFYELANLARGQVTAHITPKSWWANMEQGWVWDLDEFLVNQIGHPYQGNNYYNAARANGLSFWESAGVTAFGSATWEYFGETNHASLNDLINTTLGGIALGEMFHRAAWLIRDTRATGKGRLWKEIGATALDPVGGVKRFASGDSSRVSDKPADMVPSGLGGLVAAGALWRGSNTGAFDSNGDPFLEVDLLYGDVVAGRSRTAYDAFAVKLRFGGGGSFSEAKVRGRLLGQPMANDTFQFTVVQAYDFAKNNAYQFGSQSFNVNAAYVTRASSGLSAVFTGFGGLMVLGAVDSIPLGFVPEEEEEPDEPSGGQGVSEGPRYYDYGPGFGFGGRAVLGYKKRPFAAFLYETHHLKSLDGVRANHFLQQLRLDLLAPLKGPIGIGASWEYFDRRTYYQNPESDTRKYHFPQFRTFLTWKIS
jgi:hypothetical protein